MLESLTTTKAMTMVTTTVLKMAPNMKEEKEIVENEEIETAEDTVDYSRTSDARIIKFV